MLIVNCVLFTLKCILTSDSLAQLISPKQSLKHCNAPCLPQN